MSSIITIADVQVRQDADGRYSLNDLHKASGGERRHGPSLWLDNQQTKDLIAEVALEMGDTGFPVSVVRGGMSQGTFVSKDLVYAYAMWISAAFHLKVIRTFDAVATGQVQIDPMEVLNDPSAMRGLLLTYSEKVLELEEKVEEQAPKVEVHDRIADSTGTLCLRDAAKALQMQPLKLNQWMNANGWIYRRPGKGSWIAYQDRIQSGHLIHKLTPYIDQNTGDNKVSEQVRVTGKGLTLLAKRLNVDVDGTPGMIPPPTTGAAAQPAVY